MSNNITIELCEEDRKRLDRLTEALEKAANREVVNVINQVEAAPTPAPTTTPTEEKQAPAPEVKPEKAPTQTEEKAEPVQEPIEAAPEKAPEPSVTLTQIQQKVMQLVTGNGGAKKQAVREIVSAYAKKVSEIPTDKWDEVWSKLTALEA